MQAARLANVSKTTIRRAQDGGEFTPHPGENGEHLVDEAELRVWTVKRQKVERRSGGAPDVGAIAALAFESFDRSENPVDVVKAHQLDPDRVERLHDQWSRLRGQLVVAPEVFDALVRDLARAMDVPAEPVRTADSLRQWVASVVARAEKLSATAHRPCAVCKRAGSMPSTCDSCAVEARLKQRIRLEEIRAEARYHEALLRSCDPKPGHKDAQSRRPSSSALRAADGFAHIDVQGTALGRTPSPKTNRREVPTSWFDDPKNAPGTGKP
jgi:hypothetical protein